MFIVQLFNILSVYAIWIAFMSFFWVALLCRLSATPYSWPAGIILFLITFAIYAFDHAGGSQEDLLNNPARAALAKQPIKQLAVLAYLAAIVLVRIWDIGKLFAVVVPGIAGAIYTMRIDGIRLKDMPGMKTLIVATSTAISRAGLIGGPIRLYGLVFLIMIIDTVLCDLRDMNGDAVEGVRTVPVLLGRGCTLLILAAINGFVFLFSPVIAVFGVFLIIYFRKERHSLSYDLLVDGWMMWVYLFELSKISFLQLH